jgi:hypothetical protein
MASIGLCQRIGESFDARLASFEAVCIVWLHVRHSNMHRDVCPCYTHTHSCRLSSSSAAAAFMSAPVTHNANAHIDWACTCSLASRQHTAQGPTPIKIPQQSQRLATVTVITHRYHHFRRLATVTVITHRYHHFRLTSVLRRSHRRCTSERKLREHRCAACVSRSVPSARQS